MLTFLLDTRENEGGPRETVNMGDKLNEISFCNLSIAGESEVELGYIVLSSRLRTVSGRCEYCASSCTECKEPRYFD